MIAIGKRFEDSNGKLIICRCCGFPYFLNDRLQMAEVKHSPVATISYNYNLEILSVLLEVVVAIDLIETAHRSRYYKPVIVSKPGR